MKKCAGILAVACLLLAGCTSSDIAGSLPQSAVHTEAASSEAVEPMDEPEEVDEPVDFGALIYVADDPVLQNGLSFFGLEAGGVPAEALENADHVFQAAQEQSLSNWHGYSFYEFDGYTIDFIMTGPLGASEDELSKSFGLVTLLDERYKLECGLHVGMDLQEARALLEKEGVRFWEFALADIVPIPHTIEEETLEGSLIAWHEYTQPETLFGEYVYCLAFMYQPTPDTLGRSLCLYTDGEGTVGAISSAFWTLP